MKINNLKLIAKNEDDLRVISAHLQDSIVSTKNIVHLKNNSILLMQANRFMWEDVEKGVFRKNKRVRTVVKFESVLKVSSKNIIQNTKERFLDFLTIETKQIPDNSYEIILIFSGNSIIKINSEVIEVTIDDQGKPWETKAKPKHKNI